MRYRHARCPRGKKWNRRQRRCVLSRGALARGARKESREHPWASRAVARRIARDHLTENPRAYGSLSSRTLATFKPSHRWQVEELYRRVLASSRGTADLDRIERRIRAELRGQLTSAETREAREALRAVKVIRTALRRRR